MPIRSLLAIAATLVIIAGCSRSESEERDAANGTHAGHPAPNTVTAGGMAGPPPGSAVGGIASMKPGSVNYFDVDLAPGEYVAICFVPDQKDGRPHLMHGMVKQFSVGA